MRIHTSLTDAQVRSLRPVSVTFERLTSHGSRSHVRAFDVLLAGSGNTGGQWGNSGKDGAAPYKAATWDEWGIFLGALFDADPAAKATYYHDGADFHWQTGDRFRDGALTLAGQHLRHKWGHRRTLTGQHEQHCQCGAVVRRGHLADYEAREGGNVFADR